ncbi:MAG: acetylornithine transaminase [Candidatus Solibacter sp.]
MSDTFLLRNYTRYPLTIEAGRGCHVTDPEGKRYLDMITGIGVNAMGYAHPRITAVLQEQAALCVHASNLVSNRPQQQLAERLCRLAGLDRAFFCNSGTEAVEAALKAARARSTPAKHGIVSLQRSFHGRTMAALSVTGQSSLRGNFVYAGANVTYVEPNDREALRAAIGDGTAAVILEPVLGEGGIVPLEAEYLQTARDLSRRHDAFLIADEVQCGLGRTGKPFAYEWAGIQPDIVCVAKPLAAGLPLGATLFSEDAAQWLPPHSHGTTFGGGPLACRVALEFLDLMEAQLPHIQRMATYFARRLDALRKRHAAIVEVRSRGLMFGIQLAQSAYPFVEAALRRGLLINATQETVIRLLPPYIARVEEFDEAARILDEVWEEAATSDSPRPRTAVYH